MQTTIVEDLEQIKSAIIAAGHGNIFVRVSPKAFVSPYIHFMIWITERRSWCSLRNALNPSSCICLSIK